MPSVGRPFAPFQPTPPNLFTPKLGGRFGYFLFFSARGGGRGRGSPRSQERGGQFCIENFRRGGLQEGEGVSRRVVRSELGNFVGGGGGLNIFGCNLDWWAKMA